MSLPKSLNEEEIKIAQSQVFFYEKYAAAYYRTEGDTTRFPAVVCVPPRSSGGRKQWIAIDPLTNEVSPTPIKQPDQDRTVVFNDNSYCTLYYYYDELPCCIGWTIIATILLSIFTTPLILLCCIPMLYKMIRAKKSVEEGDEDTALKVCKPCCCWCVCAVAWISAILPLTITGLILGIVFAVIRL